MLLYLHPWKKNQIFLQLRMFKVSSQPLEGYLHIFLMVNNLQFFLKKLNSFHSYLHKQFQTFFFHNFSVS